jgi:hypothetical protein
VANSPKTQGTLVDPLNPQPLSHLCLDYRWKLPRHQSRTTASLSLQQHKANMIDDDLWSDDHCSSRHDEEAGDFPPLTRVR